MNTIPTVNHNSPQNVRQSNFELLRIVAMLMIVAHHLAVHGVQHCHDAELAYKAYNAGNAVNRIFASVLIPGGGAGVALFFMITGFFLCRKEAASIKNVALQAGFYSILLCVCCAAMLAVCAISARGGV